MARLGLRLDLEGVSLEFAAKVQRIPTYPAAEGYAWATGKVGVCFATSGPGATNLITALVDALMDSIPVVAITGQVPRAMIGRDAFQETDITGITLPITKHNYLVTRAEDLAHFMRKILRTERFFDEGL